LKCGLQNFRRPFRYVTFLYVCMYVCMYVIYLCMCVYVLMCVRLCVCVHVSYIYVYYVCICILYVFIHYVVCLTTDPQPLPKRVLHRVRYRAFSPVFSTHSFLSCLPVAASVFFLVVPSFIYFFLPFLQ